MEDTLGGYKATQKTFPQGCLNPCSNGRYSRRKKYKIRKDLSYNVLILVLMEDTLGAFDKVVALFANKS